MGPESEELAVTLRVNGVEQRLLAGPRRTLLEALRDGLGLGSVREACGLGVCGACTVLVDGRAISSCLMLAVQAEGAEIVTVEGLSAEGRLHPVQQAFIEHAAFQCAYCTPGFILTTVALLAEIPQPDAEAIREYLSGNLCRCGSYVNILAAVQAASRQMPAF
jgi:aerobic-type carbon monoxide dehydrogenase small subunit (CoxS/CutS family)